MGSARQGMRVIVVVLICAAVCFNPAQGSEQEDQGEQGSLVRAETPGDPLDAEDDPVAEANEEPQWRIYNTMQEELMQLIDLNGDGKVSLAEIQAFFKKEFYSETQLEQTQDEDGNSIALPEEELGELAEMAESDAKEFLDELDTNKDGFLSLKELAAQYLPNAADARESDNGEDGYREDEYTLTGGSDDEDYEEFSDEDDSDEDYSEYEDSDDEPYETKEDEAAAQHLLGDIRTEMRQQK